MVEKRRLCQKISRLTNLTRFFDRFLDPFLDPFRLNSAVIRGSRCGERQTGSRRVLAVIAREQSVQSGILRLESMRLDEERFAAYREEFRRMVRGVRNDQRLALEARPAPLRH